MKLIHYNPIFNDLSDPYTLLSDSGLEKGHKVLEIGCGAGYYTIPAAEMVSETGTIFALDINSLAMKDVEQKKKQKKLNNIILLRRDAMDTGLDTDSIDVSFLFGVPRLFRMNDVFQAVFKELFRITRPNGLVAIKSKNQKLIAKIESLNFSFDKKTDKIMVFKKKLN